MMKRIISLLACLLLAISVEAQVGYQYYKNEGMSAYRDGRFSTALKYFRSAKAAKDYDKYKTDHSDLNDWIKKCNMATSRKTSGSGSNSASAAKTTKKQRIDITRTTVTNSSVDGQYGLDMRCNFFTHNMKGRSGRIKCTFLRGNRILTYDDGEQEYDSYVEEYREVGVSENFSVTEEGQNFTIELKIPYAALRLASFENQEFKCRFDIYDEGDWEVPLATEDKRFTVEPVSVFVDGNTNTNVIDAPADGGYSQHNVRTGGEDYYFSGLPEWCHIENKTPSSFRIMVDRNYSTEFRSCEIKVHTGKVSDGGNKVRFMINQAGGDGDDGAQKVQATIYQPQIIQNVLENDGHKYMRVCSRVTVSGLTGRKVYFALFFYQDDNMTPLVDEEGKTIKTYDVATAAYENSEWSEWCLRIANKVFLKAVNATPTIVFDLVLQDEDGNVLARKEGFKIQAK